MVDRIIPLERLVLQARSAIRGSMRRGIRYYGVSPADRCYLCNERTPHFDHVEPKRGLFRGRLAQFLVSCCWACNRRKAGLPLLLYLAVRRSVSHASRHAAPRSTFRAAPSDSPATAEPRGGDREDRALTSQVATRC